MTLSLISRLIEFLTVFLAVYKGLPAAKELLGPYLTAIKHNVESQERLIKLLTERVNDDHAEIKDSVSGPVSGQSGSIGFGVHAKSTEEK